ncbi:MAG: hypothetical protein HUJ63_04655, partial [Enterococcus sp.]|nr:hypothetical protein [Enterococcus sp.]
MNMLSNIFTSGSSSFGKIETDIGAFLDISVILENFASISDRYDAFLVDVFGVIFDGRKIFDGVLELMKELKSAGKKLIILSNTTLVADVCKTKYQALGLTDGVHYDVFISSGEAFRQTLREHILGAETYFQAVSRNDDM